MRKWHHQRGMTAIGWLLVLGLIAFFTLITLRLVPIYLEYSKVVSVLESLANEPGIGAKPRSEIIKLVNKRFDINDVRKVSPKLVKLSKDKGITRISIDYERREHLMANLDVVASFSKEIEVPSR
ncbi:uncharacterized protein DUF4845 [Thiogranum longum]|uniref:Uncharacterized protein DUF4845 n=1 Tax=Thiogranum longum TaxID=1537524 RepID=A0A4R1HBM7_9GAMM|nr:DUF4845 domain-containing protein [Thiogranum longum]TCK17580.1 uncharacterized protein DUF4845 [Thiogranum longum]